MIGYLMAGALLAGLVIGALVIAALRRAARSAIGGAPTPAEAQIHAKAQAERAALPRPSLTAVHAMSDKEIENAANDRSSLVPPRK